ncbi:MAG: RNA methyltransferase [Bacilli bacterium]|nr:RNA methyltransferase [Bacilli bacterium]
MLYTSINNPKIKKLNLLKSKKYRDRENMFIVEGDHLVKEAYNNGYLKEILVRENVEYKLDVETNEINKSVEKYLSELETPTGIFGICTKKEMNLKPGKILVLDGIQDPGNMGTIIRSSKAFNIDTIVINDKCVDPYNSKVIRATQGMIFSVNIIKANLETFIKEIKHTHKVFATKVDGGESLKNVEKPEKFVIIMGSEGQGVSQKLLSLADTFLYIPMNEKCESLNVAIATSIILYEFGA